MRISMSLAAALRASNPSQPNTVTEIKYNSLNSTARDHGPSTRTKETPAPRLRDEFWHGTGQITGKPPTPSPTQVGPNHRSKPGPVLLDTARATATGLAYPEMTLLGHRRVDRLNSTVPCCSLVLLGEGTQSGSTGYSQQVVAAVVVPVHGNQVARAGRLGERQEAVEAVAFLAEVRLTLAQLIFEPAELGRRARCLQLTDDV